MSDINKESGDVAVKSRLDNGELTSGWKSQVAALIDSVPDTMLGLITVFMNIGHALEHVVPLEEVKSDGR